MLTKSSLPDRRIVLLSALTGVTLALSACQSGDSTSVLNVGDQAKAPDPKVTEAELRTYCPRVTLRDGTAYFNTYAKGGQDDATKVVYQAAISDVTRTCALSEGSMNLKIAVAGRIVPGPSFSAGTITMPIRVVVTRGDEVLYSELQKHQVQVSDPTAATQFMFVDANINLPTPVDTGVRAFAGYDEGPPKKK